MKNNRFLIILNLALFLTIVFLTYVNKRKRIEYEYSISLPSSATNFEIKSKWWIPKSINLGQTSKASFIIDNSEIDYLLDQFRLMNLEESDSIFKRYVAPNHVINSDMTIYSYILNKNKVFIKLNLDYN